jgi:hypothetical protein
MEGTTTLGTGVTLAVTLPVGIHTITLTVSDGKATSTDDAVITVVQPNRAPVANAGPDQSVNVGTQVTLNGSSSSDADGDALTYTWKEGTTVLGSGVTLAVTLPVGIHTITLTVSDGKATSSDDVVITVVNHSPVANAGPDQTVNVGTKVILDGSGSSDPDAGDVLTYSWKEGTSILGTVAKPPAVTLAAGIHTITLTVTDNSGATSSDDVVITVVQPNRPPVANAGRDTTVEQTSLVGIQVTLDGSASSDADGDALTYVWMEGTTTLGTGVQLAVTLPVGVHTITLTVTDKSGLSSSDAVLITVVAPKITVDDKPLVLWPPNHHFETVKASEIVESVVDHNGKKISIQNVRIYSVSSDEAEDAPCNGNKHINKNDGHRHDSDYKDRKGRNHDDSVDDNECDDHGDRRSKNDIDISNDGKKVNLRAEREGGENGRVYTITLVVKDASGGIGFASYEVWVPNHRKDIAVNDGPVYTVYAQSNPVFAKESAESSYAELASTVPEEFKLYNNYPNPFNPSTEIKFGLMKESFATLTVYDMLGRTVATLVRGQLRPGIYSATFNANGLSSGIYIYRLNAGTYVETRRMVLMK